VNADRRALVRYLIPDLDDGLCNALGQVEQLLLTLATWEEASEVPVLSAPLAGWVALKALYRVQAVISPTQTRADQPTPPGRVLGPDGSDAHRPVRLVALDPADVEVLGAAAAVLGRELALDPYGEMFEAMAAAAEAAAGVYGPEPLPVQLVEALARVHGLLDLAPTDDTARLTALLDAAGDTAVVLSRADEAAYIRTAERFNAMWGLSNGLDRFPH
jgi:hypothetical protein